MEAELIVGRLRDAGLDARIVRDGKYSPGAWMYTGHDPNEQMSIVVPEGELTQARELLELPDEPLPDEEQMAARERPRALVIAVVIVIVVLVFALLRYQLFDVL